MEAVQQDQNATAESRAIGKSHVANDGNELEAPGTTVSSGFSSCVLSSKFALHVANRSCVHSQLEEKRSAPTSAPSGIAQLRKSIDHTNEHHPDPMNLDDFLVPNSIASPAGITPLPDERASAAEHARASALPIQARKQPIYQPTEPPPAASVPPPSIISNRNGEFDYVQRRLRKTSIDEGRVSHVPCHLTLRQQKLIP